MSQRAGIDGRSKSFSEEEDETATEKDQIEGESFRIPAIQQLPRHHGGDDESNTFFMSDPSISEDGDASSGNVVKAPHRLGSSPLRASSSDDDLDHRQGISPSYHYNPFARNSPAPLSPGNTSLSSWDSPAVNRGTYFFHFTPPSRYAKRPSDDDNDDQAAMAWGNSQGYIAGTYASQQQQIPQQQRYAHLGSPQPIMTHHLMPPPASQQAQRQQQQQQQQYQHQQDMDDHFLHQLRYQQHALAHSHSWDRMSYSDTNGGVDSSSPSEQPWLLQRSHSDTNGQTWTGKERQREGYEQQGHASAGSFDENRQHESSVLSPLSSFQDSKFHMEESIAMTLSESDQDENDDDEEEADGDEDDDEERSSGKNAQRKLDSETQNSADDEKTAEPRPRVKKQPGKAAPGHRRQRSGDAAAASLATGREGWKGMDKDKIPLPAVSGDDEDEDEDSTPKPRARESFPGRVQRPPPGQDRPRNVASAAEQRTPLIQSGLVSGTSYGSTAASHPKAPPPPPPPPPPPSSAPISRPPHYPHHFMEGRHVSEWPDSSFFTNFAYTAAPQNGGERDTSEQRHLNAVDEANNDESESDESDESSDDNDEASNSFRENRFDLSGYSEKFNLDELEQKMENADYVTRQKVLRSKMPADSPFANFGKKSAEKAPRKAFLPQSSVIEEDERKALAFYICPRCGTRQREFFTVDSAPRQLQGPSSFLALYFTIYVIVSLFIFGLEEGWKPLDCIYFAVITLTTAGLGDFVPTTDANKIICSIFIYFGVACIGLLLGSYIAGMLDDKAYRDRKTRQIESCPNCKRIQTLKDSAARRKREFPRSVQMTTMKRFQSERCFEPKIDHTAKYASERSNDSHGHKYHSSHGSTRSHGSGGHQSQGSTGSRPSPPFELTTPPISEKKVYNPGTVGSSKTPSPVSPILGSPVTRDILGRQKHTRHESIDASNKATLEAMQGVFGQGRAPVRKYSADHPVSRDNPLLSTPITEGKPLIEPTSVPNMRSADRMVGFSSGSDNDDEDDYSESESSMSTVEEIMDERTVQLKAAKYVFLTLRQALVNSMVIIAVGCLGFWFIEGFSLVDSWYFTTVLLTTVGYGDIVPVTRGGKLFATIYILVAGTILLNNMSLISMIPLELRKRRIERAVLTQFGDQLDDAALRELATGPVIQRLHLSANRPDGLDECTREMFALAMLVRLGKVTEEDIRQTFAAFQRLDVNDEGVLNSKSIIAAMIQKRRSQHSTAKKRNVEKEQRPLLPPPPPLEMPTAPMPADKLETPDQKTTKRTSPPSSGSTPSRYWVSETGALHVETSAGEYIFHHAEREANLRHQARFRAGMASDSNIPSDLILPSAGDERGQSQRSQESPF